MATHEQTDSSPVNLQLWYGRILVADLLNVIVHQGTWFGLYRLLITRKQGKQETRLCDFVAFCEKWHQRLKKGKDPDAAEFDQFKDVIYSGLWRVPFPDGNEMTIPEGPTF